MSEAELSTDEKLALLNQLIPGIQIIGQWKDTRKGLPTDQAINSLVHSKPSNPTTTIVEHILSPIATGQVPNNLRGGFVGIGPFKNSSFIQSPAALHQNITEITDFTPDNMQEYKDTTIGCVFNCSETTGDVVKRRAVVIIPKYNTNSNVSAGIILIYPTNVDPTTTPYDSEKTLSQEEYSPIKYLPEAELVNW